MSTATQMPVAQRYAWKSKLALVAMVESLMVMAVMGPVGRRTRRGWVPVGWDGGMG
jgi:hypothetical protein